MNTSQTSKFWTPALRAEAIRLSTIEGLSCSEIAKCLGAPTRNYVIGLLNRAGVSRRAPSEPAASAPRLKAPVVKPDRYAGNGFNVRSGVINPAPAPLDLRKVRTIPLLCEPVGIEDLRFDHCRYPVNAGDQDYLACGSPKAERGSYCESHALIAFTKPPTDQQRTASAKVYAVVGRVRS